MKAKGTSPSGPFYSRRLVIIQWRKYAHIFFVFYYLYRRIHRDVTVYIFAHQLTHTRCSSIYQLGSKTKRAGQFMQFVQVSALCNQQERKQQQLKTAKLLGGKTLMRIIHFHNFWDFPKRISPKLFALVYRAQIFRDN